MNEWIQSSSIINNYADIQKERERQEHGNELAGTFESVRNPDPPRWGHNSSRISDIGVKSLTHVVCLTRTEKIKMLDSFVLSHLRSYSSVLL